MIIKIKNNKDGHFMKSTIDDILQHGGYKSNRISPIVFCVEDLKEHPEQANIFENSPPSFSIGGIVLNTPFGWIWTEKDLFLDFDSNEIRFIISHEIGHILGNHFALNLVRLISSEFIGNQIRSIEGNGRKSRLGVFYDILSTCGEFGFKREFEIEADLWASRICGKEVAVRTIKKLAGIFAENNLDMPTHFMKSVSGSIPIITFRDRIENILQKKSES